MGEAPPKAPRSAPPRVRALSRFLSLALFLLGALLGTACSRPAPAPVAATPALPDITLLRASEFTIYAGDSIVATERVDHHSDRFESTLEVIGSARATYTAYRDSSGIIHRIESRVLPWNGLNPTSVVAVEFRADSVIAQHLEPVRYTVRRTRRGGVGALPYIHPSPGLLEQIVLRAAKERAEFSALDEPERIDIRVWLMGSNRTTNARVTFVSNRVLDVEIADVKFRAWLDEFGLMLAEVPSLGWLIQRRAR